MGLTSPRDPRVRLWIGLACAALAAIGLALWSFRSAGEGDHRALTGPPRAEDTAAARPHAARSPAIDKNPAPANTATSVALAAVTDPDILREGRLARAEQTLESYLQSTQYPPFSRPMRENPDLIRPHHVDAIKLPLARADHKLTDAKVTLHQDRYFLVGDEPITLSIACETSEGPAPCEIVSASARAATDKDPEAARAPIPVAFSDQGRDGDRVAGDGAVAARFQPSQAFPGYHGPIRVDIDVRVGSESGGASFEFDYTPAPPATFTGVVREVLADGSLDLYVGMRVLKPGRYVVQARADDADDRPFAYLSWNEEMAAGDQEVRLHLFGKLIRDEAARAPFRLRDLEGFLLEENTYPDRELMPALEGVVHTTKRYAESDFSTSEWQSDEKTRRVDQLTQNLEKARTAVE